MSGGVYAKLCWRCFFFSLKTWKYQFWHKTGSQADLLGFSCDLVSKTWFYTQKYYAGYVIVLDDMWIYSANIFTQRLYEDFGVTWIILTQGLINIPFVFLCVYFFSQIFERCLIHCTAFHYLPGRLFKYWRLQHIDFLPLLPLSICAHIVSHIYYTNKKHTSARNHVLKSDVWRSGNLKWDFNHVYQHLERFKVRTGISKGWLKNKNLTKKWNRIFLKAWQMPEIIFWCLVKAMDLSTDVPF